MSQTPTVSRKLKTSSTRDTIIAVVIGIAVACFLVGALLVSFDRAASHGVHGILVEKIFEEEPVTEISVGSDGLKRKEIPGKYSFKVRDKIKGTMFTLSVSREVFDRYSEGDEYFFKAN